MELRYAQALWEMAEKGVKPKDAVRKIRDVLAAEGRAGLLPRVGKAFRRVAEREARRQEIVLSIARERDKVKAMREAKAVLRGLGTKTDAIRVRVDDTLIGGWRLEGREFEHDASFKKQLLSMYNRAIQ